MVDDLNEIPTDEESTVEEFECIKCGEPILLTEAEIDDGVDTEVCDDCRGEEEEREIFGEDDEDLDENEDEDEYENNEDEDD